ncbi:MAG: preprotein translocase subunit SecD, partial [Gammaproteobacteria bacterium]|nr:preprotein translocase subunit SecD [Gammaproteobacteria bacterium]NIR85419.1 preprotein translocase subunit SecD [Gammaproteobacteria bacterium]NIU06563.1 preprotein translocase subunit SecD [Gammaproteobacteria bacterium]NIV53448.1 protein translocase subunit SecD [Gammaproteobacteria bacterium]NIX87836.1 protein translocase subunit SecD [Gammaproteobacteria bacterium]
MNRYPLWKYLLIIAVLVAGVVYALPNLFGEQPAVQVSPAVRAAQMGPQLADRIKALLEKDGIPYRGIEADEGRLIARFANTEDQLRARDAIDRALDRTYSVALNLVPKTPAWLQAIDALPMYLGLDLRGGVHFLMEVDMDAAIRLAEERYLSDIRSALRDEKVRYVTIARRAATEQRPAGVEIKFRDAQTREEARKLLEDQFRDVNLTELERGGTPYLMAVLSEEERRETKRFALQQNLATLRNRVNELGVAEPVIQQHGEERIVVQLPGVQDPVRAREILGATATLEYHAVDTEHGVQEAVRGRVPLGSKLYRERETGDPILLKKRVIVTGDQITDAASGFDQQSGSPAVFVTLNDKGARKMDRFTKENVGKPMAVVYIETKTVTTINEEGEPVKKRETFEEVISVANIRERFSKRFQTTGLDNTEEAADIALLLRAGALAAPVDIVEERTIGPSLG